MFTVVCRFEFAPPADHRLTLNKDELQILLGIFDMRAPPPLGIFVSPVVNNKGLFGH